MRASLRIRFAGLLGATLCARCVALGESGAGLVPPQASGLADSKVAANLVSDIVKQGATADDGARTATAPLGVSELTKLTMAAVKSETMDAQANVDAAFLRLQGAADTVSKAKSLADSKDLELLACREREKKQAALRDHINALSKEINVECKARDEMQIFEWAVNDIGVQGSCDFSKSGLQGCGDFSKLKTAIDAYQATFATNQKEYPGKAKQCKSMLYEVGDFLADKGEQNFLKTRGECEQLQQEADFAICAFGNRLNERCAAKQEFDKLVEGYMQVGASAAGSGGTEGLAAFAFGLDVKAEAVEELNLDIISCSESNIQFSGYRWDTSEYVKESFAAQYIPGKPFALCFPVDCKGSWGEWSECTGECGTATMTRHFMITAPERNDGFCPRKPEIKFCNNCPQGSERKL